MLDDEKNDDVMKTFNKIIHNPKTIILYDNDIAYNLALKRNNLGGVPRSDKSGFKSLTICDEYIWESLLAESKHDILFVTRDETYLDNEKILVEEYKETTGKSIKFIKYVSTALNEIGEEVSKEAMEKEQSEQDLLIALKKLHNVTGIDIEELDEILVTLTAREEEIIRMRFGLDGEGPKTLKEVSEIFGISLESVRRIEAQAFRKLRNRATRKSSVSDIIVSL